MIKYYCDECGDETKNKSYFKTFRTKKYYIRIYSNFKEGDTPGEDAVLCKKCILKLIEGAK